jgi:uncharacterized SAM-binding protein YcdF (DUF218 family)
VSAADVGKLQRWERTRWHRFAAPLFAIWPTGSLLMTAVFLGGLHLSVLAGSPSNATDEQIDSPPLHVRF